MGAALFTTLSIMDNKLSSVSVFFPCYNDAGTIGRMVEDAFNILPSITGDYEVIVINDASTDNSRQVLSDLEGRYPNHIFRVIDHSTNRDYGGALQSGFSNCMKDFVFYTDGDAQYDVKEIVKLIPLMDDDVGIVTGHKSERNDAWYRGIIGLLYRRIVKTFFSLAVIDVDCDFRLIRRSVLQNIPLETTSGAICIELLRRIQDSYFRIAQVTVSHFSRIYGESQCFKPAKIWKMLKAIPVLWWKLVFLKWWKRIR